jgi:hypothetical protein
LNIDPTYADLTLDGDSKMNDSKETVPESVEITQEKQRIFCWEFWAAIVIYVAFIAFYH